MTQSLEHQPAGLYVQTPDRQPLVFPLKHTEVQAKVTGNLSRVEVTQSFENPFTTTLEAIYIFPLPDEAAVDEMLIRIGDRTISGSIKKRQEAQQIYQQAKQQGRTAALLEQERDNIFTQSLANIKPGEQIDVIIRYTDSLKFVAGDYEFVFPMVVGPRYIPGISIEENTPGGGSAIAPMTQNQDTDLVPDASRLNAPIVPPGMRSRHDINVTIEIDAGVEIQAVRSSSHQIQVSHEKQMVRVQLAGGDTIPNKDLILRYQVASDRTQATVLTQADERGGHFALYFIPAIQYHPDQIVAKDVVFLIDTSGSQMGAPLMQCQELMRRFINGLNSQDTFSIINFADTTEQLSPVPLPNTLQNRERAINYINQLNAGGGTQMMRGIRAVLNFPVTDPGRLRSVVLLTDGYIGNENQILAEIQRHLQPGNRLYSFGAGSSVNRFLLNRIAELGRGISRIIRHDEPTDQVVEKFFQQINHPVLTNIQVHWEGKGEFPVIYPSPIPDLFAQQPLVLFGRKEDATAGKLHISGIAAGGIRYQQVFEVNFDSLGNRAIAQLWGRNRIKELMNQMVSGETKSGVEAVTQTALNYQLLSQYTAFVAVSDEVRVNPTGEPVSVQVPVEMPEALSYQGIFGNITSAVASAPPGNPMYRLSARSEQRSMPISAAPVPPSMPASAPSSQSPDYATFAESAEFNEAMLSSEPFEELAADEWDEEQLLKSPKAFQPPQLDRLMQMPERKRAGVPPTWQIVSVTGLDESAIALLKQHLELRLKSAQFPFGFSGDLVFEFEVHQGRVRNLVLDEAVSSLSEPAVIEMLRRSLTSWRPGAKISTQVVLTVRIQS